MYQVVRRCHVPEISVMRLVALALTYVESVLKSTSTKNGAVLPKTNNNPNNTDLILFFLSLAPVGRYVCIVSSGIVFLKKHASTDSGRKVTNASFLCGNKPFGIRFIHLSSSIRISSKCCRRADFDWTISANKTKYK